ncbi:MAG: hypothetical protein KME25_27075 [Symplocastrum torsivum CPER-KK1]|uniref:Uncharacterized protein n=1 Tax=Symplocastrum torsivum CPER-KK1 TaxID=450513 RepID=A0A951PSC3_9CYAN|nr:hypothetical protein [Symplocastrum torsivum CPER-KK1]
MYLSVFELSRFIRKKWKQKPVNAIASVLVLVSFCEEVLHYFIVFVALCCFLRAIALGQIRLMSQVGIKLQFAAEP